MKTLTLLRHAKSDWADPAMRDFDRPLNRRGRAAARAMGRELRRLDIAFDAIIASPAARVVETVAGLAETCACTLEPVYDPHLYLAAKDMLLEIVRDTDDRRDRLLLLGHNPGFELLATSLAAEDGGEIWVQAAEKFPTGALAAIEFPVDRWRDIAPGGGRLTRFIRPRDLDPALGPTRV